eukprot:TRINITY_DN7342_c0_g3_i1.p1 TRINITY_DN7342_c0_g3~~TRINITY_DN7342_c0_g3_i1.p1  ORF type:complete len:124 (-),score=9.18 TRINITY_DN7342_c0_g3_i1:57-428(-)
MSDVMNSRHQFVFSLKTSAGSYRFSVVPIWMDETNFHHVDGETFVAGSFFMMNDYSPECAEDACNVVEKFGSAGVFLRRVQSVHDTCAPNSCRRGRCCLRSLRQNDAVTMSSSYSISGLPLES